MIKPQGHILVEVLLAMSLFVIIATAVLGGFISVRDGKVTQKQTLIAKGYADLAIEALRSVRERDWKLVATNGTFHPNLTGSTWELLPNQGPDVAGYRTQIVISDVSRDPLPSSPDFGDVISVDGGVDMASKKAVTTVSWGLASRQRISYTQFLTRLENNSSFEHTTCGDFDGGNTAGTVVQYESEEECQSGDTSKDGEIVLAPGGFGNWCSPVGPSITQVDLHRQGVPTTIWAFRTDEDGTTFNEVFAGTGGNASGTPFTNTKIAGNNPDITTSTLGDYQVSPTQKANSVFGTGDYAYVATDKQSTAMMILDLHQFTNPPTNSLYKRVGEFNSGDPSDANSVYVVGSEAYLTTNKLYIIDVTDKTSPSKLGSFSLDGTGTKVVVVNNVAYVGISGSSTKLEIVDVADSAHPTLLGKLVDASLSSVRDVYVKSDGSRAYIVTDISSSKSEFFIVNTDAAHQAHPELISGSSYEAGINVKGVTVVANDTVALVVGTGGSDAHPEYQAVDISNESAVALCTKGGTGKMRVPSGVYAISAVYQEDDGHAYSYIVTGDTNAELKIVEGGTGGMGGGGGYSGYYESEPITPFANDVQFNRFDATVDLNGGEIRVWLASYAPEDNSCVLAGAYPYVGPDGTSSTYFGTAGTNPFSSGVSGYTNPAKCFKYRIQLVSASPGTSPVFKDIKVNYSP